MPLVGKKEDHSNLLTHLLVEFNIDALDDEDKLLLTPVDDEDSELVTKQPNVTWLRKSEQTTSTTTTTTTTKTTVRRGSVEYKVQPLSSDTGILKTADDFTTAVCNAFEQPALETIVHPRKKAIKAKRVVPLLPDFSTIDNVYTVGSFRDHPVDEKRSKKRKQLTEAALEEEKAEEMVTHVKGPVTLGIKRGWSAEDDAGDRGILRPITNPHDPDERYLLWFLPNEDGTERLIRQKKDHMPIGPEVSYNESKKARAGLT